MVFFSKIRKGISSSLAVQLGFSSKDIIVIVNIDDIGFHKDETEASFNTLNYGMVKSGSLMVPCPNFERAIELWKFNPEIDLGIHLTLTCEWGRKYPWTPILSKSEVPSLYNAEDCMWPSITELLNHSARDEIQIELRAQIARVLETGLKPSHLDYHMNFHHHPDLMDIVIGLSQEFNLLMRFPRRKRYKYPFVKNNIMRLKRSGFVFPDSQMGIYTMSGEDQSLEYRMKKYHDYLKSLNPGVHNIKIHTGYNSINMQHIMGKHFSSVRQIDYNVWTSDKTKELSDSMGIKFISYWPLITLQKHLIIN